uniref:PolyVal ADP-Ribosyltransferase in polyvalent protein n=1 Tax=Myoviridae sp. ctWiL39 TaxID=2825120 RepID=A0A8S5PYJ8_9CAUD|nr:MAG TPA: PolyVal ADP-Ribosyltransferase in polyvalent protein [Myoviridae sp. ctWiL39]
MGFMQRFEERVSAGKNSGKTQSGAQPGFIQRFERRIGGEELSQTARDTAARYQKIFQNYDWKSGLEYDEWDEEDQQRKAAGQLPKAIEKKYDFDDPIDVYLYQNGLPPKKRIAAYAKDAETKQAATQLEQQKKQVISRNLVAPVVAGFTGIPAETLQKGLSAQQGEQQFTQQPAQKSDKRPKPYALPTPQDIEVDTVSGAAPTGRKALEQMAEDDPERKTGLYREYENPLSHQKTRGEMTAREAMAEIRNLEEEQKKIRTYQQKQQQLQQRQAARMEEMTGDPNWMQKVQKGAALELPKELQKSNFSVYEMDLSNPYSYIGRGYDGTHKYVDYFTQEERNYYNYLRGMGDEEGAQAYYDDMLDELKSRWTEEDLERAKAAAQKDPFAASLESVALNVTAPIRSAPYVLKQAITQDTINPYDPSFSNALGAQAIREEVGGTIESPFLRFLYDTGMGTLDFAATAPFGEVASLAIMGTNAFANTAREASAKGATTDEAFALGLISGAAEVLTEKVGLERLYGQIGSKSSKPIRQALTEAAKSALSEGTEEIVSEVVNTVADLLIMGDKSDLGQAKKEYMAQGLSESDAKKQALEDWIRDGLLMSYAGGAVGGLMMSGPAILVNKIATDVRIGQDIQQSGGVSETLDMARDAGVLSPVQYENAQKKAPSARKLGSIAANTASAYVEALKQAHSAADLETRLTQANEQLDTEIRELENGLPTTETEQRLAELTEQQRYLSARLEQVKQNRVQYNEAEQVAKKLGARFELDGLNVGVGKYENGTITIDPFQANPVQKVLVHELTHHLETSGRYGEVQNMALELYSQQAGESVDQLVNRIVQAYGSQGIALDAEGAKSELTALFCENSLFQSPSSIQTLAAEKPGLFQRMWQWVKDTARKVRGTAAEKQMVNLERIYREAMWDVSEDQPTAEQTLPVSEQAETGNEQQENTDDELERIAGEILRQMQGQQLEMDVEPIPAAQEKQIEAGQEATEQQRFDASQYSLGLDMDDIAQTDTEGKQLSPEQQEFFQDSKARLENGKYRYGDGDLVPVYHTTDADFTVFDLSKAGAETDGNASDPWFAATAHIGFYFNTLPGAERYGNAMLARDEKVYLNLQEPLEVYSLQHLVDLMQEKVEYREEESAWEALKDIGDEFRDYLELHGYDGVVVEHDEEMGGTTFVALYPEQIKRVNNEAPTENPDIRYSLGWTLEDLKRYSREQESSQEGLPDAEVEELPNAETARDMEPSERVEEQRKEAAQTERTAEEAVEGELIQEQTESAQEEQEETARETAEQGDPLEEMERSDDPELSKRAKTYKKRYERKFVDAMGDVFSLDPSVKRELRTELSAIAAEAMKTGQMTEETKQRLFDEMIDRGMILNASLSESHEGALEFTKQKLSPAGLESDTRKALFGKLRYDNNGLRIDVAYQEMSEQWPDLFPADITNPNDQAKRIAEVKQELQGVRQSLMEYYGDAEQYGEFRREAYNQFDKELYKLRKEMGMIERYETAARNRRQERADLIAAATDAQQARAALEQRNALRKALEKAERTTEYPLSDADRSTIRALLDGGLTEADVQGRTNAKDLLRVAEAQKAYEANEKIIKEAGKRRVRNSAELVDELLKTSDKWKDKGNFSYRRETAQRNMEDIAPTLREGRALSQALFEPIGRHAAEMTRWMQSWTKRIADLKLTKEESALVQRMGEYRLSADELKNGVTLSDGKPVDTKKINNAIETFRQFYDEALDMANDALIANGYEAVPKRQNYFPHIGEEVTGYDYFVKNILKGEEMALPTSINGITEWFSPGKPWFANFKERQGKATAYDAVRGFEQYLKGVSNVIFLTDDIQRLRTFESALREKYGMPAADESQLDAKTYRGHLSGLASWLHEYTNLLAGKTAKIDRSVEDWFGRRGLTFSKWLKSRFGANAVGANLSTAFSNFIPLTQGIATMNTVDLLSGMKDAAKSMIRNDGFAERSDFLTRRFGDVQKIATTNWQKVKNAAGSAINFPFEKIDRLVAESLVRGKYREELAKGLDPDSAMAAADEYAMKTMADRSVGQMPVLFQSKTLGFLTQFQLEVNNQISNTFKDIPRQYMPEKKEWAKAIPEIVKSWLALFVFSYLYNEVTEKYITGRRQAADPIHALEELLRDLGVTDKDGKPQIGTAFANLAENTLDMLPMGNIITGGGRIPLASSVEGASPLDAIKKTLNGDETAGESWKDFALALGTGYLLPAGGAQLKKTVQGIRAAAEGGSYKETPDGKKLKFYAEGDAGDYVRGALFGQYALPGAKEYVEGGFKTLSVAETKAFDELRDSGLEPETAESLIYELREIKSDKKDGKSLDNGTYKKRLLLLESKDLSKKQKQIIDKNLMAKERGVADYSSRTWFELWNISEKTYQKAKKANLEGISPDLFLDLYHKRKELENEDMKAKEKATEFDLYLREKGADEYTRAVAEEYFGFYTQVRAEADQKLIEEMMP